MLLDLFKIKTMKQKFKVGQKIKRTEREDFGNARYGKVYTVKRYTKQGSLELKEDSSQYRYDPDSFSAFNGTTKPNTVHLRTTRNNGFRFNLVAANGEIVATSEVYTTKAAAKKTLKTLFPEWEVVDQTKKKK